MRYLYILFSLLSSLFFNAHAQDNIFSLELSISVAENMKSSFKSEGRLFIFVTTDPNNEPVHNVWPNFYKSSDFIFAKNYTWNSSKALCIKDVKNWDSWNIANISSLDALPANTYYVQVLWQQSFESFAVTDESNLRSTKVKVDLSSSQKIGRSLSELNERWNLTEQSNVKTIQFYEH